MFQTALLLAGFLAGFDPELQRHIDRLGDKHFRAREAAHAALAKAGPRAYPLLIVAQGRAAGNCAETERRCQVLLGPYWSWYYNPLPAGYDRCPDIRWCEDTWQVDGHKAPAIIPLPGRANAEQVVAFYVPHWSSDYVPDCRELCAIYVRDLLRSGVPRDRVLAMLEGIAAAERRYQKRHGGNARPAI